MADADEDGTGAKAAKPSRKPGKKTIILVGAAAAVLIAGGAGAYVAFAGGGHGEDAPGGEAHASAGHGEAPKAASFVDLPEMTVNLATLDPEKQQYVRLTVALEVDQPEMADIIRPMMPRVLDSFQTHLRELRPTDIRGSSGVYRLKEELLRRVNVAVAPARVDAVLFKDIVVQ